MALIEERDSLSHRPFAESKMRSGMSITAASSAAPSSATSASSKAEISPAHRNGASSPLPCSAMGAALDRIPTRLVPYAEAKRAVDVSLALVGLVAGAPILALAALMVKLTSRGPVIFRQTRVGIGGRTFTCFKFRSMHVDAEHQKDQLRHLNEVSGPVFKIRNDPRVTPVGKWLRKFSIDELPQVWNVLKGDMSIVGPRPPVPSEVETYTERQFGRLAVKPGLTCLWQIAGRSNVSFDRWVELDLLYIDTMSIGNDLKIILRTIPAVIFARGAH